MPTHKIEVSQPPKAVLNSDMSFSVYSDGALLGELRISKGSIDWRAARYANAKRVRWERFAHLMEEA
jgi:hypothetical protein